MRILSTAVIAGLIGSAQIASAAVIDGRVNVGAGDFEVIDTTGLTVGRNNQQSLNLFAFDEVQNYRLDVDITLDQGGTISAGTIVSSQYVFFDPRSSGTSQQGEVGFDGKILGIATSKSTLSATDFLGLGGVTYNNPRLRGLESRDTASVDPADENRVIVDWTAGNPGDYIRIITEANLTVVPLPASGLLLLGGLGAIAVSRRRRRKG